MRIYKVLFNLVIFAIVLITIYIFQTDNHISNTTSNFLKDLSNRSLKYGHQLDKKNVLAPLNYSITVSNESIVNYPSEYDVWCIFTKVNQKTSPMRYKFERFIKSILKYSTVVITLHVISDKNSRIIAESVINALLVETRHNKIKTVYHNVQEITKAMSNLTAIMQPAFSPQRGGYYSDALFYISLDLYKVADPSQDKAVMIDVDTVLQSDIALLFEHFDKFRDSEILGLAPELSPVYQHVLYLYRTRNKNTKFGSPIGKGGFPGLNSGVILFRFDRIRSSELYKSLMTSDAVNKMINKYSFMGHLGDQDMYTLMKMEHPDLIHILPCGWNRQLCKWWRDHGYPDVFDSFAHCEEPISLYHGNCNSPIPFQTNSNNSN